MLNLELEDVFVFVKKIVKLFDDVKKLVIIVRNDRMIIGYWKLMKLFLCCLCKYFLEI